MSRAAAFICRLPIYLRFELLLSIASLRNFSQLYETCAVALAEQKRRVSRCYTHAAQRSAAAAVRLRRRRAAPTRQAHRRSLAAAPHTAAAPQPRARVPKFTVCAVVLSHRNAERTASSSGAAPAAAPRVHTAPAHGLLPVLAHTLHALPYYPKTVVGIYCCITVLLLFWPEVQAAVASVADRFRAAEWQPIEVVPYSLPFTEEELKELDADPELEALR